MTGTELALLHAGVKSRRHIARLIHAGCTAEMVEQERAKVWAQSGIRNRPGLLVSNLWERLRIGGRAKGGDAMASVRERLGI